MTEADVNESVELALVVIVEVLKLIWAGWSSGSEEAQAAVAGRRRLQGGGGDAASPVARLL